jgi:DNA-binding NarL/FixJ family response regulator
MIKIVIADDHPIFRQGIKQAIEFIPNAIIVGEAGNGIEAYHFVLEHVPDIVILDLEMPIINGIDLCAKIKSEMSAIKVIIITMHKEKHYYLDAIQAGANGYLLKDNAIEDLIACVKSVQQGRDFISPGIEFYLIDKDRSSDTHILIQQLTPTEKVILKLIAEGKKTSEIASLLFSSPNTIDNHRSNISKKLNLDGEKNALLKFAMGNKDVL